MQTTRRMATSSLCSGFPPSRPLRAGALSHSVGFLFCLAAIVCALGGAALTAQAAAPLVTVTANTETIGRYDIYEVTMSNHAAHQNPFDGVAITAAFTAPSAKTYTVGGFYYAANTWKLRFAPIEVGAWTWRLSYKDDQGVYETTGKFTANPSGNTGFLRIHPKNPCRLVTEGDGKAFYPLGFEVGTLSAPERFTEFRRNPQRQTFHEFLLNTMAAGNNIMRAYGGAPNGFLAQRNVNNTGMNTYDLKFGLMGDEYAAHLHDVGMKWQLCFFGGHPATTDLSNPQVKQSMLNYHQYIINRFGACVDIWELCNETSNIPQAYLDTMTAYIHDHDPYRHPVTVSYDQPQADQSGIDLVSGLHSYCGSNDPDVDTAISRPIIAVRTKYKKPVLNGEGGNDAPQGAYSPRRYRIQIWTAFFCEGGIIFWNQGSRTGSYDRYAIANQYIGYEENAESKVLSDFSADFDPAAVPITPILSPARQMRCYALGSPTDQGIYVIHSANHNTVLAGATVKTTVPADMQGQWIDPETGTVLQTLAVGAGEQTIPIPPFQVDIALRLRPAASTPVLQFSPPVYTVKGDQKSVTLTVSRTGDDRGAVSVAYASADALAKAGADYAATPGTLNWSAGDAAPKTITVPLTVSKTMKANMAFKVVLSSPTGDAVLGASHTALVTKVNVVINGAEFSAPGYAADKKAGVLEVQVNRLGDGTGPLAVYYNTVGKGGQDFVEIPGKNAPTLTWADGDKAPKTFTVKILDTATPGRQFNVVLSPVPNPTAGASVPPHWRSRVTIYDPEDCPGVLALSGYEGMTGIRYAETGVTYTVPATAGSIAIPVSRAHGSTGAVSVQYSTYAQGSGYRKSVGTAVPGVDYTLQQGALNWADGDAADKTIVIPIVDNSEKTVGNLTFWLYLSNPSGGAYLNFPLAARITIVNPPRPPGQR